MRKKLSFCGALVTILFLVLSIHGCISINIGGFGDAVAIVEVKGAIVDADDVTMQLESALKTDSVKAVVLRVDSPGGAVGASQEIFRKVREVDKSKPVVASMGDVAASGGYYVSAGARYIFANEGTITGSIGVRMEHLDVSGLLDLVRLRHETLKSGEYKDIGSITRAMTEKERALISEILSELHEQFKADIASSRKLSPDYVSSIADGRIFTGKTAKELHLIDEIGGISDAIKKAASLAGIKGEPRIIRMKKHLPWWLEAILTNADLIGSRFDAAFKYFFYK
jgi:protease-4